MLLNGVTFAVSIRETIQYFYASFHVDILRADTRNKPRFPAKSTVERNRGKIATIASSTQTNRANLLAGFLGEPKEPNFFQVTFGGNLKKIIIARNFSRLWTWSDGKEGRGSGESSRRWYNSRGAVQIFAEPGESRLPKVR